jgi:hypothetical protein
MAPIRKPMLPMLTPCNTRYVVTATR